jgi:chemotaxis protein MotB
MSDPAAGEGKRPIIIIKKKAGHEHHGGAWKVAFADFMTAMFALFLVLWILTQSQEVKTAVAMYFRKPTDFEGKPDAMNRGNNGLMENRQGRLDNQPDILQVDPKKSGAAEGGEGQTPESISGGAAPVAPEPGLRPMPVERPEEQEVDEVRSFLKIADDLWAVLGMAGSYRRFKDNVVIEAIEDGLVIQLVEQPNSPLFEDGSTQFRQPIQQALNLIGKQLAGFPRNKIEIDGHGIQVAGLYTPEQKWMASTMLADLARIQLVKAGMNTVQIAKVSGCADSRPLNPRDKADPLNQRISILVRPRQWRPERY